MYQISRKYSFSAAHRIEGHPKCGRLHGHNYEVEVTIDSFGKLADGMVLDYGALDAIVKPLIDELDHRYLLSYNNLLCADPYGALAMSLDHAASLPIEHSTAECLAEYLHGEIQETIRLKYQYREWDLWITVRETPKSEATYFNEKSEEGPSDNED